jgi:hypothetical protein
MIPTLRAAIGKADNLCALAILQPGDCAVTAELVQCLTSERSPLKRTGLDYRLDRALWRTEQAFHLWLPQIRAGRARPADWAGDLKSNLVSVKAELERLAG